MSDADHIFLLFMGAALLGMILAFPAAALLDAGRRLVAAITRRHVNPYYVDRGDRDA